MEGFPGPVYRSWDEAMSDPNLDLTKPWFVVPDPVPVDPADFANGWPEGWTELGYTEDASMVYYRPIEADG
jgi:hypothetical protein